MPVPVQLEPFTFPALVTVAYVTLYYVYMIVHLRVKNAVKRETLRLRDAQPKQDDGDGGAIAAKLREERRRLPVNAHPRNIDAVAKHPAFIRADRACLNMLEQMPPFLCGLWLYAVFVDPTYAGYLGLAYVASRSLYYALYTNIPLLLSLSTFPNYGVIAWFFLRTAYEILV